MESEFVFHRRDDGKLVKVQMVGAASAALGDSSSDAGKFYLRLKKNSNNLHQKLCHWSAIMFRMTLVGFTKPWFLILSGLLIHLLGRVSECLHLPRLLLKVSSRPSSRYLAHRAAPGTTEVHMKTGIRTTVASSRVAAGDRAPTFYVTADTARNMNSLPTGNNTYSYT